MKNYLLLILICMSFGAYAQEFGKAVFLGDKFHNLQMSSGEIYNKNTMVIAGHRTLPYGTQLKITNIENGKSVIATVKDRGPFISGEIVVLSRKAGEAIGMIYNGKASVKVEVAGAGNTIVTTTEEAPKPREVTEPVENTAKGGNDLPKEYNTTTAKPKVVTKPEVKAKPAPKSTWKPTKKTTPAKSATGILKADILNQVKSGYGVQIGVFSDLNVVIDKVTELKAIGFSDVFFTNETKGGKTTYKIIIGNYNTQEQATAYKNALRSKYKLDGFVVDFSEL